MSSLPSKRGADDDGEKQDGKVRKTTNYNLEVLLWRDDPLESFSDWTIEIVSAEMSSQVYHVHRNRMARGERKSEYFVKLFQKGGQFLESQSNKSIIELDSLAAEAFPFFLDYVYGSDANLPLEITTETATALYSLGEYFGVFELCSEAYEFCRKDVSLENATVYGQHSMQLNTPEVEELLQIFLAAYMTDIDPSSPLIKNLHPKICEGFLSISLSSRTEPHASKLTAAYFENRGDSLDAPTFSRLTAEDTMTAIDPSIALQLCDMENQVMKAQAVTNKSPETLSSLERRCIGALSRSWETLRDPDNVTL
jgi:BTB/POZ domain